jgi:hypothetical protein
VIKHVKLCWCLDFVKVGNSLRTVTSGVGIGFRVTARDAEVTMDRRSESWGLKLDGAGVSAETCENVAVSSVPLRVW